MFANATLVLPTFLASHMALQRSPMSANLWGWGAAKSTVSVKLDGKAVGNASVDGDGSWELALPPQPASTGRTIEISSGNESLTLEDIVFGDVYLCSGQSNMEFSTNMAFNASAEIADSANYPHIRLATPAKVVADAPLDDDTSKSPYIWSRAGPAAFDSTIPSASQYPWPDGAFTWFSATCYFFGRELYKSLGNGKVPIGLLASDWGGQKVEAFSSPDALADATCGGTRPIAAGAGAAPSPPSRR